MESHPCFCRGRLMLPPVYRAVLNFLWREDGPTAVEYAVMLAAIVTVCMAAVSVLGKNASASFSNVSLNAAVGGSS